MIVDVSNIDWDTDGDEEVKSQLPRYISGLEIEVDRADEISDVVSDVLSDTYGFCHFGFDLS